MKEGDKIKVVNKISGHSYAIGHVDTIVQVAASGGKLIYYLAAGTGGYLYGSDMKLINNKMKTTEKFVLAFKSEPEKSFRKAGLTNGDDLLTEDGVKIFLGWLLRKNGDDFKNEVVDDLLKDDNKDK